MKKEFFSDPSVIEQIEKRKMEQLVADMRRAQEDRKIALELLRQRQAELEKAFGERFPGATMEQRVRLEEIMDAMCLDLDGLYELMVDLKGVV